MCDPEDDVAGNIEPMVRWDPVEDSNMNTKTGNAFIVAMLLFLTWAGTIMFIMMMQFCGMLLSLEVQYQVQVLEYTTQFLTREFIFAMLWMRCIQKVSWTVGTMRKGRCVVGIYYIEHISNWFLWYTISIATVLFLSCWAGTSLDVHNLCTALKMIFTEFRDEKMVLVILCHVIIINSPLMWTTYYRQSLRYHLRSAYQAAIRLKPEADFFRNFTFQDPDMCKQDQNAKIVLARGRSPHRNQEDDPNANPRTKTVPKKKHLVKERKQNDSDQEQYFKVRDDDPSIPDSDEPTGDKQPRRSTRSASKVK
jgi:hypothetical protein